MFRLHKPTDDQIRDYLATQSALGFSYDCIGCTRGVTTPRRRWNIDRCRALLGYGDDIWTRARLAIESWQMFPSEIATICWPTPPREGLTIGVLYWAAPVRLWILFPARVVCLISDSVERDGRRIDRFGFAYGTLPDHPERGEERFLIERDARDDSIWYDLCAVSQPAHWLARLGYPYTRYEQARFRRLSSAVMQRVIAMA